MTVYIYGLGQVWPKNFCPTSLISIGPQMLLQKLLGAAKPRIFKPLSFAYRTSTCLACLLWLFPHETSSSSLRREDTASIRRPEAFSFVATIVRTPPPSSTVATPIVTHPLLLGPNWLATTSPNFLAVASACWGSEPPQLWTIHYPSPTVKVWSWATSRLYIMVMPTTRFQTVTIPIRPSARSTCVPTLTETTGRKPCSTVKKGCFLLVWTTSLLLWVTPSRKTKRRSSLPDEATNFFFLLVLLTETITHVCTLSLKEQIRLLTCPFSS